MNGCIFTIPKTYGLGPQTPQVQLFKNNRHAGSLIGQISGTCSSLAALRVGFEKVKYEVWEDGEVVEVCLNKSTQVDVSFQLRISTSPASAQGTVHVCALQDGR